MIKAVSPEGVVVVWTGSLRYAYYETYTQISKKVNGEVYELARIPGDWVITFEDSKVEKLADRLTGRDAIEYTIQVLRTANHRQLERLKSRLKNYNAKTGHWKE